MMNKLFFLLATAVFASDVAFVVDTQPALSGIKTTLAGLPPGELASALSEMTPALYKGSVIVQENNAFVIRNTISERFQVLLDTAHCFHDTSDVDPPQKQFHGWVAGVGDFLSESSLYSANTGGSAAGVDWNMASIFAGVVGAYTHSDLSWNGSGDINSGYAGVYFFGSGVNRLFYGNLSVIGAWSHFNERRNIIYPGVDETAKNNHNGTQLISHFDTGFNIGVSGITIRPFDGLDWIFQRENSYRETGGGAYDLFVTNNRANMLRNEFGLALAACNCFQTWSANLDLKFSWVREVRVSGQTSQSAFLLAPKASFFSTGYFPNRNLFSFAAAINVVSCDEFFTGNLYYNGNFGKNYSDNSFGGQFLFAF
jgi:uncharacterized protein with beta-barrel porin domain